MSSSSLSVSVSVSVSVSLSLLPHFCFEVGPFFAACFSHEKRSASAALGLIQFVRVRVVIRAYEQVVLCACAACCWCATMRLVSWMKLSRFADEKLFGCG